MRAGDTIAATGALTFFALFGTAVAGWITHIWWIFSILMANAPLHAGRVLLAFFGVFIPPIGALHGVYLWFNAW
jgi:hypothetical protein